MPSIKNFYDQQHCICTRRKKDIKNRAKLTKIISICNKKVQDNNLRIGVQTTIQKFIYAIFTIQNIPKLDNLHQLPSHSGSLHDARNKISLVNCQVRYIILIIKQHSFRTYLCTHRMPVDCQRWMHSASSDYSYILRNQENVDQIKNHYTMNLQYQQNLFVCPHSQPFLNCVCYHITTQIQLNYYHSARKNI